MINRAVAEALASRQTLYHRTERNADGTAKRCRVNGACKLWKRQPSAFRLPVKYGLKGTGYVTPANGSQWLVYDPTEVPLLPETPPLVVADWFEEQGQSRLAWLVRRGAS